MSERIVLAKEIPSQAYEGRRQVHLFDLENSQLSPVLWEANPVPLDPGAKIEFFERPRVALVNGLHIYLGLNTGQTHKIAHVGNHQFAKSFPSRFLDTSGLRHERSRIDDLKVSGYLSIRSLVPVPADFENRVIEASYGGVFELAEDISIQPEFLLPDHLAFSLTPASSLVRYDGELCYVNGSRNQSPDQSSRGDLVDILARRIVFGGFTPFDGSGCRQARYHIEGDRVFLAHGNYPDERITVKDMKTREVIGEPVRVFGTIGFAHHQGEVFDVRDLGYERSLRLMRSVDGEEKDAVMDFTGKRVTSFASTNKKGVVVAVYDEGKNATQLLSHLDRKPFAEFEGRYSLIPSTLGGSH